MHGIFGDNSGRHGAALKRMKAGIVAMAVILAAVLTACGGDPAAESVELTGEWILDGAYTTEANGGLDLRQLYGSALSAYGAFLRVNADGGIEYDIGVFSGRGTWQEDGEDGQYTAELVVSPEEYRETLTFFSFRESQSDREYLALNFGAYVLYWVRVDAE